MLNLDKSCKSKHIEELIDDIISAISTAADNPPKAKFRKALKYWNNHLTLLSKQNKGSWVNWLNKGRPTDENVNMEYKEAKREFRRVQKAAMAEYGKKNMEAIVNCQEIDQAYFWFLVNKNKRKGQSVHPIKNDHDVNLTKQNDIVEEWKKYFSKLYTPKMDGYDACFKRHVDESIKEMTNESYRNGNEQVLKQHI